jgi:hypothetical protein
MREMKPGECFDIPPETFKDMSVPLEHPLDRPDQAYKIRRLQDWLPFETRVDIDILSGKITFVRLDR